MSERIYLSPPHMKGNEQRFIKEAFDTNWVSPLGPNVDGFEQELSDYTGSGYAAALSSGTGALHLALDALNVGPGDEVIVSTFTFAATVNPIRYRGAEPVFVESEEDSWNMCPETLEQALKTRVERGRSVKAIIVVHLYGQMAKMDEIMAIANKYEIPVVEDAAEALGSKYKGKHAGTIGQSGIFSFNGNKIITTSGGGALVSDDQAFVTHIRFLSTQARDPAPHYQHTHIGYNYRMSNIIAGIGRGQLEVLDEWVSNRRANYEYYREGLKDIEVISFSPELDDTFSNRWLTCILIEDDFSHFVTPEMIRLALEDINIESRPLWKPMHRQPIFKDHPYFGDNLSTRLFEYGLCLPSGSALSNEAKDRVIETIRNLFGKS